MQQKLKKSISQNESFATVFQLLEINGFVFVGVERHEKQ